MVIDCCVTYYAYCETEVVESPSGLFLFCYMSIVSEVVKYNGMLLHYNIEMSYGEFCDKNPQLETRKEWGETTSDAMDAYYYCKDYGREGQ